MSSYSASSSACDTVISLFLSILIGVSWNVIVVFIYSPLMTTEVGHLFMCSFALLIRLWVEDLFKSTKVT